jgi:hypothetical protein
MRARNLKVVTHEIALFRYNPVAEVTREIEYSVRIGPKPAEPGRPGGRAGTGLRECGRHGGGNALNKTSSVQHLVCGRWLASE